MKKKRVIRKITEKKINKSSNENKKPKIEKRTKIVKTENISLNKNKNIKKIRNSNNFKKNLNYSTVKPITKNGTIYIIGGGPSLKEFNFNNLYNKTTISINKSFFSCPNTDIIYWTDSRFYNWYKEDIDEHNAYKYTISPNRNYNNKVNLLKKGGRFSLEKNKNSLSHGNNSGYAAINLAYHLGAKTIVLLGYDMKNKEDESHFHGGYKTKPIKDYVYDKQFIPGFNILKKELDKLEIRVFNANMESKLECFPKISITNALNL